MVRECEKFKVLSFSRLSYHLPKQLSLQGFKVKKLLVLMLIITSSAFAANIKVLTLNVFALPDIGNKKSTSDRMQATCNKLLTSDYDAVLLQEVWMRSYRKDFKNCGFDHVITFNERSFGSGLIILSKHPVKKAVRYILPKDTSLGSIFRGEGIARKSLYLAQIEIGTRKVWLANTHLAANYCDNDERVNCVSFNSIRQTQLEKIAVILKRETSEDAVVFGGDLNMGAKKRSHDPIWDELGTLLPGYNQAPVAPELTTYSLDNLFNVNKSDPGKIDHLFGNDKFLVSEGKLAFTESFYDSKGILRNYSDHSGWESVLTFKE